MEGPATFSSRKEPPMTSGRSQRPVSPLRARMIEDMTVRGFKQDTRRDYVRHVRAFAAFIGRSPDTATAEDLRLFQLQQTQSGIQPPSINSAVLPKPSPTKASAAPNPHRRPNAHRFPAGSFFGGFRTPALYRVDRSRRAGIRNPLRYRPFGAVVCTARGRHLPYHRLRVAAGARRLSLSILRALQCLDSPHDLVNETRRKPGPAARHSCGCVPVDARGRGFGCLRAGLPPAKLPAGPPPLSAITISAKGVMALAGRV